MAGSRAVDSKALDTMKYLATITSKRRLTIPVDLYKQMNFQKGQRVVISKASDGIKVEPAAGIVERLFGSVKVPIKLKGLSFDKIRDIAREERCKRKGY